MGKITFKRLARIRRKRENRVIRRNSREREKYPRPAIVHSLARLRPSEQQAPKETVRPYINHPNCRNRHK